MTPPHRTALAYQPLEFPAVQRFSAFPLCESRLFQRAHSCTRQSIRKIAGNRRFPRDRNRPTQRESLSGCLTFSLFSIRLVESTVSRRSHGIRFSCLRFPFTL